MKLDKLPIEKSIYLLDWNPNDPNGYNDWMKMIMKKTEDHQNQKLFKVL